MNEPSKREKEIFEYLSRKWDNDSKVFSTEDKFSNESIFVFSSLGNPRVDFCTYSTIGLSRYNHFSGTQPVRLELIGCALSGVENFDNLLASCAYYSIANNFSITYGSIIHNIMYDHEASRSLEHITFVAPFLWENLKYQAVDGFICHWLLALPISSGEANFLMNNGIEKLEREFERKSIDVLDLERDSLF